jgi:hypothetical protein
MVVLAFYMKEYSFRKAKIILPFLHLFNIFKAPLGPWRGPPIPHCRSASATTSVFLQSTKYIDYIYAAAFKQLVICGLFLCV